MIPSIVLAGWDLTSGASRVPTGLIHDTYFVTDRAGRDLVVQRVHPIFGPPVLEDIEAVTAHLAARGLLTPRLVRTASGDRGVVDDDGRLWRALSRVPGTSRARITSARDATSAGDLVGRFHVAVADLDWEFRSVRAGVHDTAEHLARLAACLGGPDPGDGRVALAETILEEGSRLPRLTATRLRVTHGDLKISNLLFDEAGEAIVVVDLDTMGRLPLAAELGDAFRSWCNPGGEDASAVRFDVDTFEAALAGYGPAAAGLALDESERADLVIGVQTISLELASRFCRDVFEDRYFGWDPTRFASRPAHNLARATAQLALSLDVAARRAEAEKIAARRLA